MKKMLGVVAIILAASCYGLISSIVKIAYKEGYSFVQITFSQYVYGSIGLALLILLSKSYRRIKAKSLLGLLLLGFVGLGGTSFFINASLNELPASLSLVLLFQFTWIGLVLERIFLKKRIKLVQKIAVGIILLGTTFVLPITTASIGHITVSGVILGLLAAICFSIFVVGTSRLSTTIPVIFKVGIMVGGTTLLLLLYFSMTGQIEEVNPFGAIYKWGLLLGLLAQLLPPLLFAYGAPIVGATTTTILSSVQLPVGILLALVILKEQITEAQISGVIFILAGILLSQLKGRSIFFTKQRKSYSGSSN